MDFRSHEIREAILNNDVCEAKLHVVTVCSNPCEFKRRYSLTLDFSRRMEANPHVIFYLVELAYYDQKFCITSSNNKRHLQIRAAVAPLWHKENLINIAVEKLLPSNWKAFAWIDGDIEFDNPHWATDALRVLNGSKDIVQLFSHAVDMDREESTMNIFSGFGFQYCHRRPYTKSTAGLQNFWHPGYAWACTRKAYSDLGGLYEVSILGSGDHIMSLALIGKSHASLNQAITSGYKSTAREFQRRGASLRLGYIPGVIRHYFHGTKKNRKYSERWQILTKHQFNPLIHIKRRPEDGLIVPTESCPPQLLKDIMNYFAERNEDET